MYSHYMTMVVEFIRNFELCFLSVSHQECHVSPTDESVRLRYGVTRLQEARDAVLWTTCPAL
jgi:hypothetical protein